MIVNNDAKLSELSLAIREMVLQGILHLKYINQTMKKGSSRQWKLRSMIKPLLCTYILLYPAILSVDSEGPDLQLHVCYPAGTQRWNSIESTLIQRHDLFQRCVRARLDVPNVLATIIEFICNVCILFVW